MAQAEDVLPPGSQGVLPPPSPLRTGHEGFPSSGSGPLPLSPVLLVTLPMAPGVYETFVGNIVLSTLTCKDNVIRFYVFSWNKRDGTQSASIPLSLVQHQPLFRNGFPSHLLLLALYPVLAQSRVIGRTLSLDFGEAGDRGCIGFDQFCLPFIECPVAIVPKVARFHPLTPFVRVSAFCPIPEH